MSTVRAIYSAILPQFTQNIANLYNTNRNGFNLTMLSYGIKWPELPENRPEAVEEDIWSQIQQFTTTEFLVPQFQRVVNSEGVTALAQHAETMSRQVCSILPNGYDNLINSFNAATHEARNNWLKNIAAIGVFGTEPTRSHENYPKLLSLDNPAVTEIDRLNFSIELLQILHLISKEIANSITFASKIATKIIEQQNALHLMNQNSVENTERRNSLQENLLVSLSKMQELGVSEEQLKQIYTPYVSYTTYEQVKDSPQLESWKTAASLCTGVQWPDLPKISPPNFGKNFSRSNCSRDTQTPSSWEMLQFAAFSDRGNAATFGHRKAYLDNNPVLTRGNWFPNSLMAMFYTNVANYDPRKATVSQRLEIIRETFLNEHPKITKSNWLSNYFVARWYPNWVDNKRNELANSQHADIAPQRQNSIQDLLLSQERGQVRHEVSSSESALPEDQLRSNFSKKPQKVRGLAAKGMANILGNEVAHLYSRVAADDVNPSQSSVRLGRSDSEENSS